MARSLEESLAETETLLKAWRMDDAYLLLSALIEQLSDVELRVFEADMKSLIQRFLPKRRKQLLALLVARLSPIAISENGVQSTTQPSRTPQNSAVEQLGARVASDLRDLKTYHIFQWSTYYRDFMREVWESGLEAAKTTSTLRALCTLIRREFEEHAREIFSQGYDHVRNSRQGEHDYALGKSVAGLKGFLELPLELYSFNIGKASTAFSARAVQEMFSSIATGIFLGFSNSSFGPTPARDVYLQSIRSWIPLLALLTREDLDRIHNESARLAFARFSRHRG
jgi:hypothetical protein